jgi:hypothetical protein
MSPSPESGSAVRVEISEKDFDVRVRGRSKLLHRLGPWLMPALLSGLGWLGGGVLGYYQGLKASAARVAADELEIDRVKHRLERVEKDDDRGFVVQRDHDVRILTVERQLKIEGPVVVVPK